MADTPRAGKRYLLFTLLLLSLAVAMPAAPFAAQRRRAARPSRSAGDAQLLGVRRYIKDSWRTLRRSNAGLAAAAVDPKFHDHPAGAPWPVYVSRKEDLRQVERSLRAQMTAEEFARIELRRLPEDLSRVNREPGLLYLPRPYVVPGGRFNEMYGWDSYFIHVGLLRDGETELAKDMTDNHLYQVEHYGKVLNANRTYFLTRSQPPFLARMVLDIYRRTGDRAWLRRAAPLVERYYRFWNEEPHLVKQAEGLARYYDFGEGPAPEVLADERDAQGRTHYDRVKEFYRAHEVRDYDLSEFYNRAKDELTPLFYKGDRSMRESGFDPSNRFGQFNVDIVHYAPVCLNSLLYMTERDGAEIMRALGRAREAREWERRARRRREAVNRLMWDDREGLYYDYNFRRAERRRYPFATTFYPLWAGIATPEQAHRVASNLHLFERRGGLRTSTNVSGSQWDAPFGWAPLQLIAAEGLRRYGYTREADRLAVNFLSLVLKEFTEHNNIVEKYDVERRESDVSAGIKFGYETNVVGFGWTNAAFVEMYAGLPEAGRRNVLRLGGVPVPAAAAR